MITVGDAELDVRETLELQGPFATWMRDYLAGTPPAERARTTWAALARVLLASNEFLFVE